MQTNQESFTQTIHYEEINGKDYYNHLYYNYKLLPAVKLYKKPAISMEKVVQCSMVDYTDPKTHKVVEDGKGIIQSMGILLLDILMYLYNIGVRFEIYTGVKNANALVNQMPIDNEGIKRVKDFYLSLDIKIHKSGEVPIPSTLGDYEWMAYVDFSDDHTRFTVRPKPECNISNPRQETLYTEAVKQFYEKHYKGSTEEACANRIEYCVQQSIMLRARADLEFILALDSLSLPKDATVKMVTLLRDVWDIKTRKPIEITELILSIGSFESLLKVAQFDLFSYFMHGRSKYGTHLRLEKTYELDPKPVYTDVTYFGHVIDDNEDDIYVPDPYECITGHNEVLSSCFDMIDKHPTIKNDPESLKTIMHHLSDEFKGNKDPALALSIQNYFWSNGLGDIFDGMYTEEIHEAMMNDDHHDFSIDMLHEELYTLAG